MNTIIVSNQKFQNTDIWVVSINGREDGRQFCKSAYSAMRYMFLLKRRTGCMISENCLQRLSFEIARKRKECLEKLEAIKQKFIIEHSVDIILAQPSVDTRAEEKVELPKPIARRGRKPGSKNKPKADKAA